MRRTVPVLLATGLLSLTLLGACKQGGSASASDAGDLTTRLLFTATGAYDAQADRRGKVAGGERRVYWASRPPLPARAVTVLYDGNARSQSWLMTLDAPTVTPETLAGRGSVRVQTPQGEGLRPAATSPLKDVLILSAGGQTRLLTRGYVTGAVPELLPAFGTR